VTYEGFASDLPLHRTTVFTSAEQEEITWLNLMTKNQSMARDTRIGVIAALCFAVFGVSPILAQSDSSATQDQWQFSGAIYLWGADIGGQTIRGSEVEVEFSDLFDNLEMAFMGAFAARKNNWSLLADVIYMDLGVDKTADLSVPVGGIPIPVTTSVSLDVQGLILHFAGGYNLYTKGETRLDLIGGARYLDLDQDMFLALQSLGPGLSRTISEPPLLPGMELLASRAMLRWENVGFCPTTLMLVPAIRSSPGKQPRVSGTGPGGWWISRSSTDTSNGILIRPGWLTTSISADRPWV
jgi:hypothetical protein